MAGDGNSAEGSAGLIGKVSPNLSANLELGLSDMLKDFMNTTSSATANSTGSATIGDKSAASGRSSIGGAGLFKTIVYAGLAALAIGAFLYWDNGK